MILVTGATGALGSATIDFLLKKTAPSNIAALVRDPEKAVALREKGIELRTGNYDDPASLEAAFAGIDRLFFVSGNDIPNRAAQHRNVVAAAKKAGVGHVTYTSFDRKTEDGSSPIAFVAAAHLDTEQALRESGIPHTILRNGLYADMLPMFLGEKMLETGTIYQPAADGRTAFTLRADMAEAGAAVLTSDGHAGKTYRLVAGEAHSYADVATMLSEVTGREIRYVSPTAEEFSQTLAGAGVPAEYVGLFTSFGQAIAAGEFADTRSDFERLIGREAAPLHGYLREVYG